MSEWCGSDTGKDARWLLLLVPLAGLLAACGPSKYDKQVNVCLVADVRATVVIKEFRDLVVKAPDPQLDAAFQRACRAAGAR